MDRRPERGAGRDERWTREREQRRRVLGASRGWPEDGEQPGREWEHERTGGTCRDDDAGWERSPREPGPPLAGRASASGWSRDAGIEDRSRGRDRSPYGESWRRERHDVRFDDRPARHGAYDRDSPGDFGERSYGGYGDRSSRAVEDERGARQPSSQRIAEREHDEPRTSSLQHDEPRTSAERWGLGRSGAHDEWGADLRGAVEARAGRFAGRGPRGYRRTDERIREDVCDLLLEAEHVDASGFDVQVSGGEVTLEGTVPDRGMKRAAEDLVERVAGVEQVHNRLRVESGRITGAVDANGQPVQ